MVGHYCAAQELSDIITVTKKNGKPLKTFYRGKAIEFKTTGGRTYAGNIHRLKNNTLTLVQYVTHDFSTQFGTKATDTISRYTVAVPVSEIEAIHVYSKNRAIKNLAPSLMQVGGLGYVGLNLVNGLYLKTNRDSKENKRKNRQGIAIGLGSFVSGTAIKKFFPVNYFSRKKDIIRYTRIEQ